MRGSLTSTRSGSDHSLFSDEPLQSHRIPGGGNKDAHVDPSLKRRLPQNKSAYKDVEVPLPNMSDTEEASRTGNEKTAENRAEEGQVSIDNCDTERKDQPTPDRNPESHSRAVLNANSYISDPSGSDSYRRTTNPCSTPSNLGTSSAESTLTTANAGSFSVSLRTNTEDVESMKSLSQHQDEEREADFVIPRMETSQEKIWERTQLDHNTAMNSSRSCQRMDKNDSTEGYGNKKMLAKTPALTAEEDEQRVEKCTPQPSNRLFSKDPTDEVGPRHRYFSTLRAPRKKRSKPDSPSYSFSLRSRNESPDLLASLRKLSRNQQASGELKGNRSRSMHQKALVAKRSTLMYNSVASYTGTIKVAISISLNRTTMGEVVLLPRSATGPRRALTGDEFYIVKQGYVECDIGFTSVTLFAGDHLGIPAGQSFEMRNPSASNSDLFFFSPRDTLN